MNRLFLDTSFLLALSFQSDSDHDSAVKLYRSLPPHYLTTEYVLAEFLDAEAGEKTRRLALAAVDALLADAKIVVVPSSTELVSAGLGVYRQRMDKEWGLTDCISFVVMQQHGVTDALTADHHFEQAGFGALLRS